ncbi:hypothetical protein FIBSPDRAFT_928070 [Athelia psychrophila]|uniref:Uncharacterized protein n=1 Tax=Athelia psychrophila TaxID=1759441 RepID=A0A166QUD0_9AGAM|nr:hypothetical protein FIBSPDRAFT_928070 [Fibularhizoctonia sp. CBS 109695]
MPSQSDVRPLRRRHSIGTLDPARLVPSDCLNLAGVCRPTISTANESFILPYHAKPNRKFLAFPAGSRGFLYLSNADEPQSSRQIRFRVTDSDSPEGFESGYDLLLPSQRPWSAALGALGKQQLAAVRELLLKDGWVSDMLPHARPKALKQSIQTLDPSRLRPADYLNLAGTGRHMISTPNSNFKLQYMQNYSDSVPFPDPASGFLYLHAPVDEPKVMWQIRFRVTDHASPTSFEFGSDLLYPNQTPWFISMGAMKAHKKQFFQLRQLLIRDGLDMDCLAEGSIWPKGPNARRFIHSLGQSFLVDFQHYRLNLVFVGFGADSSFECPIPSPFLTNARPNERGWPAHFPYRGSAWCCFEAHSSPDSTQPDTLALRIKKMITPVTTIRPELVQWIPMPQEGELVMRYTRAQKGMSKGAAGTLDPQPWTLDARMTAHPMIQAILRGKTVH